MTIQVTVVITVWYRYKFLEEALESVVNQNAPSSDYEILLVGKIDENILNKIISKVKIKRGDVKIAYEEVNEESIGAKLYKAIKIANGKIITFLEDDDIFYHNKLSVIEKLINCEEKRSFLRHAVDLIDEKSNVISRTERVESNPVYITNEDWFNLKLPSRHSVKFASVSSMAICKSLLENYSDFIRRIKFSPDILVLLISALSLGQKIYYLDPLGAYRLYRDSFGSGYGSFDEFIKTSRFKYKSWYEDGLVYSKMLEGNKRLWDINLGVTVLYKILFNIFNNNNSDIKLTVKDLKTIIYLMRSTYTSKTLSLKALGLYILSYLPYQLRKKILMERIFKDKIKIYTKKSNL
ncbi:MULTISPECIES: glycosyltransferase [Metallosphaera]|uniref:Glycosyl transferase, family 2 n=2 Tax=Metallosphaera sedula TaxID=43687 RepID=A4YHS9_METS5|nr:MULTISPECIES: glycosyltransferase [Metallosphaera]ABP95981.1 glycosyl transferase, family 2 [Metallosphaera sedula DSM 5348]AIM27965.1 glycosyl transferase, family 2 [Metallosphaera sedula]AKV74797.1 hypothetical protein MsedA_1873 [Metallosphaera sedula]AKV77033.1 hypothetical protein MsedB_1875 [Metallosphaera sedula]AKV79285.1 hypothetical protein MsedC_1873 [Metallosphaera sedula]